MCYNVLVVCPVRRDEDMVREENVKLMSKIAIFEKRKGKAEISMHSYYKGDYVRLNTLKAVVSSTVSFVLIAALVVIYKLDYILANIMMMDYKIIGIKIAVVYIVWVLLYWLLTRVLYAKRYEDSRSDIIIYNHNLKKLQEEAQKEVIKTKGGVVVGDDFIDF